MNDPHVWKLTIILVLVATSMMLTNCSPGDHNLPDGYYAPWDYAHCSDCTTSKVGK